MLKANSFSAGAFIAIGVQSIVSITFVKPANAENCLLSVTVEFNIQHVFKPICSIHFRCQMPTLAIVLYVRLCEHLHNGMCALISLLFIIPDVYVAYYIQIFRMNFVCAFLAAVDGSI